MSTELHRITIIDELTFCALFHSTSDLKAAQMNMQHSLELGLHKFKVGYNTFKVTQNIGYAKDKGAVDHGTVPEIPRNCT